MKEVDESPIRRKRGRPVDVSIEAKVMRAAIEVYAEVGWAGFSIGAVAKRSNVGKSAIYRRWSSQRELFLFAWAVENILYVEAPDTGDIRADLIALGHTVAERLGDAIGIAELRFLLDVQIFASEIDDNLDGTRSRNRAVARERVDSAIALGQLPEGTRPEFVFDTLRGTVIHSYLLVPAGRKQLWRERSSTFVAQVVDVLLAGVRTTVGAR